MRYRIVKRPSWWTRAYTTGLPQFLHYDYNTEHFELASYGSAKKHKYEFSPEEIKQIMKDYPHITDEFIIETVRDKGDML